MSVSVNGLFRGSGSGLSPPHSPDRSYLDEPWNTSPASVTTDTDDDSSLASSLASLSPDGFDLDRFLGEIDDDDDDNTYLCPSRSESIYRHLEKYPLHSSPHDEGFIPPTHLDDDILSPLTFSPPGLAQLHLLSLSKAEHHPTSALNHKKSSTYSPPSPPPPYDYYSFFDYDSPASIPIPCSPSRRRSSTLPELEPTTSYTDPFGLHDVSLVSDATTLSSSPADVPTSPLQPLLRDIDMDMDVPMRWRSLPGCETDDDLIPLDLASKNYIPDPSAIVPTTSTGTRSLLLWDNDGNRDPDHGDIPRSPSPENFYLDPAMLAECGDEEMQKLYELRQRTAKNDKWERERCRELSALLRLKLHERGVPGGSGDSGDCGNHQSRSRPPSCCSNLSFSSPSSDSLTVYQPQSDIISSSSSSSPSSLSASSNRASSFPIPSNSSSTLPWTSGMSASQPEGSKHKVTSMAQLVASMLFHRQSDDWRRHMSGKARLAPTSSHSHYHLHPSSMGGTGMTGLPTPRSRLSEVTLPEELELDSEEGQGAGQEVKSDDEGEEEGEDMDMDVDMDVDDRPLSCGCMDMDLELEERGCGNSSSHSVTSAVPPCTHTATQ